MDKEVIEFLHKIYEKEEIRLNIYFNDIQVHNNFDLCSEKTCANKSTKFTRFNINGFILLIPVCDEHAEKIEATGYEYGANKYDT